MNICMPDFLSRVMSMDPPSSWRRDSTDFMSLSEPSSSRSICSARCAAPSPQSSISALKPPHGIGILSMSSGSSSFSGFISGAPLRHKMRLPQRGFALFISFAALTCLALSFWQVQRLQWKNGLIEARQKLFEKEALSPSPSLRVAQSRLEPLLFQALFACGNNPSPKDDQDLFAASHLWRGAQNHPPSSSFGRWACSHGSGASPRPRRPLRRRGGRSETPSAIAQNPKGEMSWDALFLPPESGGVV